MPSAITKNCQSPETLRSMAHAAFPDKQVMDIEELTAGMFNAAYHFTFDDGSCSILKIAAATSEGLMSNEICLMTAEVRAMEIARENGLPYVAKVQYHDTSRTLCSGEYFFMECMPGQSYAALLGEMTDTQRDAIDRQIGQYQKSMTAIAGKAFGMLGDERSFAQLCDFVGYLLGHLLDDAQQRNVAIPVSREAFFAQLEKDRAVFDEVTAPSLVHWDMWPGNIFVQENELSGIIDWERAMWTDPLMDDRFRRHSRKEAFLEGFGHPHLSQSEMRRIYWYDIILYLTMMVECYYRMYETDGQYHWAKPLLLDSWEALQA